MLRAAEGTAIGFSEKTVAGWSMIVGVTSTFAPEWFQSVVEHSGDLIVAVNGVGTVLFVNESVRQHLGYKPDELIGQTALRIVAEPDQSRAVETLLFASGTTGIPSVLPFRLVAKSGEVIPYELMAESRLDDPDIQASIIVAREARSRALAEETLDALVSNTEIDHVLKLLLRMFDRPLWALECAVVYEDQEGDRRVIHTGLPDALRGIDVSSDSPWQRALRSGEKVEIVDFAELPADMRSVAEAESFKAVWTYPVADPGAASDALLIVWSEMAHGPVLGQGMVLDRVLRLMRLAFAQRDYLRQLQKAATHDPLTNLPNREMFSTQVEYELKRRDGVGVGLLYLDLDGFKPVNDAMGHHAGDRVLETLAARMVGVLRPNDLIARLGGDEFGVLCLDVADMDVLVDVADRLVTVVNDPIEYEGAELAVGVSIGLVLADGQSFDALMRLADRAMYEAKANDESQWRIAVS